MRLIQPCSTSSNSLNSSPALELHRSRAGTMRGNMKRYALPFSLALLLLGPVFCFAQSDPAAADQELAAMKQKAQAGDADAQIQLGMRSAMAAHPDMPEAMK